jgi:hypothetical protein
VVVMVHLLCVIVHRSARGSLVRVMPLL